MISVSVPFLKLCFRLHVEVFFASRTQILVAAYTGSSDSLQCTRRRTHTALALA